jgi:hypothetical protein
VVLTFEINAGKGQALPIGAIAHKTAYIYCSRRRYTRQEQHDKTVSHKKITSVFARQKKAGRLAAYLLKKNLQPLDLVN